MTWEKKKKSRALGACDVLGLEKPQKETGEEANKATEMYVWVAVDYCLPKIDAFSKNT